ncbi:peptidase C13 family-domain-containing protein [Entophlyctis helioformis]|nr:peptidase C13 family-domain-containing protein [Entophlyctis helioformis]
MLKQTPEMRGWLLTVAAVLVAACALLAVPEAALLAHAEPAGAGCCCCKWCCFAFCRAGAARDPGLRLSSLSRSIFSSATTDASGGIDADTEAKVDGFFSKSGHTNNWAVLVCTSRFWFNYRHIANTLSMYRTVKRLGIPDSNIILMLADDVACNARNRFPATVYNNNRRLLDLYGSNVEVDYRGYDVTVENFIRLLTGRVEDHVPRSKRLLTDDRSNILVFLTGHGGEDFLKFQDAEELALPRIFFLIDTCQAASMYSRIYSPNVLAAASSLTGESSYSHHVDYDIGVSVIDRFTYYNLETLERLHREDQENLANLFATYDPALMHSTAGIRSDLFRRQLSKVCFLSCPAGLPFQTHLCITRNLPQTDAERRVDRVEIPSRSQAAGWQAAVYCRDAAAVFRSGCQQRDGAGRGIHQEARRARPQQPAARLSDRAASRHAIRGGCPEHDALIAVPSVSYRDTDSESAGL